MENQENEKQAPEIKVIRKTKSYAFVVNEYTDGSTSMIRTNENFSILELLGVSTLLQKDMLKLMEEGLAPKADKITRTATGASFFGEDYTPDPGQPLTDKEQNTK